MMREPQSAGADWGSRTTGLPAGVQQDARRGDHADADEPECAVHPGAQRRDQDRETELVPNGA
jgi:hypothetical protein